MWPLLGSLPASAPWHTLFLHPPTWRAPGAWRPGSDLAYQTSQPMLGDRLILLPPCTPGPPLSQPHCTRCPQGSWRVGGQGGFGHWEGSLLFIQVIPHLAQKGDSETSLPPQPGSGALPPGASNSGTHIRMVVCGGLGVKKNPMVLFWILPRVLFLLC